MTSITSELGRWIRRLHRRPASALGIVVTLALGIGISAGMFSVLHGVALSGLPYADYKRIVNIFSMDLERGVRRAFTAAEAVEGLSGAPGFEHVAYYNTPLFVVVGRNGPLQMQIANVSAEYFSVFGVSAALGRTLNEGDFAENRPVVVLNHAAWTALTGGDPDVVGRALTIRTVSGSDAAQLEVVGVLPQWFEQSRTAPLLYRPWDATAPISSSSLRIVSAVGKLAPGSAETAAQALQTRLTGVQEARGLLETDWQVRYSTLIDDLVGDVRRLLLALFAVSLLVLLIACSTASSLISIRFDGRRAELSVRRTLGASRGRAALDASLELVVLAVLGTLGGIALAYLIVAGVQPLAAGILPRAGNIRIDGAALVFAVAAALVAASLSAAFPLQRALGQSAEDLHPSGSRVVAGGRRIPLLPAAGIGLAAVALVTALVLASSLRHLATLDPGFRTQSIAALEVTPPQPAERAGVFLDRALEELRSVPGVLDAAAIVGSPPVREFSGWTPMEVTAPGGDGSEPVLANVRSASARYHRLLGIPLLGGRDIAEQDTTSASRVVVVNETLARQLFGDADPVGEALLVNMGGGVASTTIVGVVADTRNAGLRAPPRPEITFSLRQMSMPSITLLVSAPRVQPNLLRILEEAIRRADPNQAVVRSYMLADELGNQMHRDRFFAAATGWFAVLALLLGAIGINAVIAAMQRLRTREIGLRLALGAAPRHAAALVLVNAARIVGLGAAAGMVLAVPAVGGLRHVLFGVEARTFWGVFALTAVVLITVAMAAAGWPAWRASRTAPMEALRYE